MHEAAAKILVVDDEENIRHLLKLLLRKEGYHVRTAEDGQQALKELLASDYDVVLCDVRMPTIDGIQLLDELRRRSMSVAMVVMSAYGSTELALDVISRGAFDYVSKPFKNSEALFAVRKALAYQRARAAQPSEPSSASDTHEIVHQSGEMRAVLRMCDKVAAFPTTVLLHGESGTGKELIAHRLHAKSPRVNQAFIAVNCGAIPHALLESELFGHAKGAFTDASRDKIGMFEAADRGTLFLDEVAELPLPLQVKLLRTLQEGEIRRVGESKSRQVDVRVIGASAVDLRTAVDQGQFREDLYYRLNVLTIELPALRQRPGDVVPLVAYFMRRNNTRLGTRIDGFSPRAMELLQLHNWPGNVRELENMVERAMVLAEGSSIVVDDLPAIIREQLDPLPNILRSGNLSIKQGTRYLEKELIARALAETEGNRTAAARLLEISHRALLYKIKEYFPDGGV